MTTILTLLRANKWVTGVVLSIVLTGAGGVAAQTTGTPVMSLVTGGVTTAPATSTPAATETATAGPSATAASGSSDAGADAGPGGGGGGKNVVKVTNRSDNKFEVRGSVQVNHIPGPNVEPVNIASAYSSCTGCQTYAVALQINLIATSAQIVRPQNAATAVNYRCSGCTTVARAVQYNFSVDDPRTASPRVNDLVRALEKELKDIKSSSDETPESAQAKIDAVIAQFNDLANSMKSAQQTATTNTTPTGSPTATAAGTGTVTPTATGAETPTPGATGTATPETPGSPTPTSTAAPAASSTVADTPTATATGTPGPTETPTASG